jgi:GrpB-like predicted nucleotidyltransferase (UPF0157 family)
MSDPFREAVALADVDPGWESRYEDAAADINAALGSLAVSLDHIGSTSVPLRGKPIIDIQVGVASADRATAVDALAQLGYAHHGEVGVPGRNYLTRRHPAVNLHVFAAGDPRLAENRRLRDYLRAHDDARERYLEAKEGALAQGNTDLESYSRAKRDCVEALCDGARRWTLPLRLLAPEVQERLEEVILAPDRPRAAELLVDISDAEPDAPAAMRLMLAALSLSRGSPERLAWAVQEARLDYRNVLMWAETREHGHWWHNLVWADPDVERLGSVRRRAVPQVGETAVYSPAPAVADPITTGEAGEVVALRRGWVVARWERAGIQRVPIRNVQRVESAR